MAAAATCEIDCIGVVAVGQCKQCRRAFCSSHRASGATIGAARTTDDLYPNLCTACAALNLAATDAVRARFDVARKKAASRLPSAIVEVRSAAQRRGWPGADWGSAERLVAPGHKRLFGGWQPPVYEQDRYPMYILGTVSWAGDEGNDFRELSEQIIVSERHTPEFSSRIPTYRAGWNWARGGTTTELGVVPKMTYEHWHELFILDRLREIGDKHDLGVAIPNLIG